MVKESHKAKFLGLFGLTIFALFSLLGTAIAYFGLAFMLIAALWEYRTVGRALWGDPVITSLLILATYVLLLGVVLAQLFPPWAEKEYHSLWPWLCMLCFPLVAWWSRGDDRRVLFILSVALLGLFLASLRLTDWNNFLQFHHGRADFGMTFLDAALYIGSALLGWLVFVLRIVGKGFRWARVLAWSVVVILLVEMLFLTQSRSVLGALAVLLPLLALVAIWRTKHKARLRYLTIAVLGIVVIAVLGYVNRGAITRRLTATQMTMQSTLQDVAAQDWYQIPHTSLGSRFYLYRFGLHQWLRRPVFGWGPGMNVAQMMQNAPVKHHQTRFSHLHNGYLEVLVRFGAVGFILVVMLAGLLVRAFFRAWKRGDVPDDVALFLVAASLLAAATNLTDFRLVHLYYRFYTLLLLGILFGYTLRPVFTRASAENPEAAPKEPNNREERQIPNSNFAEHVYCTETEISVSLRDGSMITVPLELFPVLANGSTEDRDFCQLSDGGARIVWPDLDLDIAISTLYANGWGKRDSLG